jgi:predicted acetyltransferase
MTNIEILPATEADMPVVRTLFQLYVHDMSDFIDIDVGADGQYPLSQSLRNYRDGGTAREGRPFLFRAGGKLAGLALVRQIADTPLTFDMGEFFILRKYRRTGLGRHAACALFDLFPGKWEVRELLPNKPAQAFWHRIIDAYTGGKFTETQEHFAAYGREFLVQKFSSAQK